MKGDYLQPWRRRTETLVVGDAFRWCRMEVEVLGIELAPRSVRAGRYLTVTHPVPLREGETLRLHYYADEVVDMVSEAER